MTDELLPLQRLYHWERTRPHAVYMTQPMSGGVARDYSWAQTADEARRMAAYLKSNGWPEGSRIGLISKNCAWWVMADLAIWMAGYVSVPLYPTLAAGSVRQILDHSEAKALFVGKLDDWPAMRPGVPKGLPCISFPVSPPNDFPTWDDIVCHTAPIDGSPVREAGDLATIIYTSGTTGVPKGVMHSFRTFALGAEAAGKVYAITQNDRVLSHLPLAHVGERWAMEAGSLRSGFRVFFAESLETFARDLVAARPTFFGTVPRLWVKFQQGVFSKVPKKKLDRLLGLPILGNVMRRKLLKAMGLDQVRFASSGAAPLPVDVIHWYARLGIEILEVYGMSENFAVSHATRPGQGKPGFVGAPYPGVECKLGENNEVLVRSPCNMLGYYKEPEKTRETLTEDGWLSTGDRGEIDAEGRLRITGRAKEIFKTSKGKYVAPAPIENLLARNEHIEASCVAGAGFPQPFAMAMLSPASAERAGRDPAFRSELAGTLAAQREQINAQLDPHEHLDFICVVKDAWTVENGFVTPTMKVKRNEIESAYGPHFEAWAGRREPVVWQ